MENGSLQSDGCTGLVVVNRATLRGPPVAVSGSGHLIPGPLRLTIEGSLEA
jgi:hypothetical protein